MTRRAISSKNAKDKKQLEPHPFSAARALNFGLLPLKSCPQKVVNVEATFAEFSRVIESIPALPTYIVGRIDEHFAEVFEFHLVVGRPFTES